MWGFDWDIGPQDSEFDVQNMEHEMETWIIVLFGRGFAGLSNPVIKGDVGRSTAIRGAHDRIHNLPNESREPSSR